MSAPSRFDPRPANELRLHRGTGAAAQDRARFPRRMRPHDARSRRDGELGEPFPRAVEADGRAGLDGPGAARGLRRGRPRHGGAVHRARGARALARAGSLSPDRDRGAAILEAGDDAQKQRVAAADRRGRGRSRPWRSPRSAAPRIPATSPLRATADGRRLGARRAQALRSRRRERRPAGRRGAHGRGRASAVSGSSWCRGRPRVSRSRRWRPWTCCARSTRCRSEG